MLGEWRLLNLDVPIPVLFSNFGSNFFRILFYFRSDSFYG